MPTRITLLGWLFSEALASPNHDDLQARVRLHRASQAYSSPLQESRRLDDVGSDTCQTVHTRPLESIRIGWEFVQSDSASQTIKDHVANQIMSRAIAYWQRILKVHRLTSPLRANWYPSGCTKYAHETIWTCTSVAAPTCGTDGVTIPTKFLSNSMGSENRCPTCATLQQGAGAVDYDFFVFVTLKNGDGCEGATEAYATACVQDQCDRPIFASVNFCLSKIELNLAEVDHQVATAVHELAHALGFSSSLFKYFRNADGTPKLAREANDATRIQGSMRWSCSSGSYTFPDSSSGTYDFVDLQAKGLVTTADERGIGTCPCPLGKNTMSAGCLVPHAPSFRTPSCVVKMITPKVVEKVRAHFNCDTLVGAELENQATSSCTIIGSHWEQRIFMGEVMTATATSVRPQFVSAVTLALFEDSGWYKPDYAFADTLVANVHWGYQQGCSFATGACISNGVTSFPRFWCSSKTADVCSWDRKGEQSCGVDTFSNALPSAVSSYYSDNSVGALAEADYCPFYSTTVNNRNCTSTSSITMPYGNVNFMREVFGTASRCLDTTLHGDVEVSSGIFQATPSDYATTRPGCYDVLCASDKLSYTVKLSDLTGSTQVLGTCTSAGQALTKSGMQGQVTCAAPAEMCFEPSKLTQTSLRADSSFVGESPDANDGSSSLTGKVTPNGGSALINAAMLHARGSLGILRWAAIAFTACSLAQY